MIHRTPKDENNPFTMVDHNYIFDENLSLQAVGLLTHMLSLPDDWQFYEDEIKKHHTNGISATRAAMKELIKHGYVVRTKLRDEHGRISKYQYEVFENPTYFRNSKIGKSKVGKTYLGESHTTNNNVTNNNSTNNKYTKNDYNDNGVLAPHNTTTTQSIQYFYQSYKNHFNEEHPRLKTKQLKNVQEKLDGFMDEWSLDFDNIVDMIDRYFNTDMDCDYNINHFVTEGVLLNRFYDAVYREA